MRDDRTSLSEIVWQEICPWLLLIRPFRVAISARVLLLSAAGLVAMVAGWQLIGSLFSASKEPVLQQWIAEQSTWPWSELVSPQVPGQYMGVEQIPLVGPYLVRGPLLEVWLWLSGPFRHLFHSEVSFVGLLYLTLCGLWAALVWGLFGGAIARIASLAFTRDEHLSLGRAIGYGRLKWGSYFLAPLLPIIGVVLMMLPLMLLGLVMRLGLGVLFAGLVWPLVLVAGFLMTILLVGLLFGWPLMWPTISTEGTDSFDALSRSYAYVYQRPLHFLFYGFIASLVGILGTLVVDLFAHLVLYLSGYAVSWGLGHQEWMGTNPQAAGALTRTGGWLIAVWTGLVKTLQVGFRYGFFWCSATAIYLLLRRNVDATELEEVRLENQRDTYGLPPLRSDAAGVVSAADVEAASSQPNTERGNTERGNAEQ